MVTGLHILFRKTDTDGLEFNVCNECEHILLQVGCVVPKAQEACLIRVIDLIEVTCSIWLESQEETVLRN